MKKLLLLLPLFLTACSANHLDANAQNVRVMNGDPKGDCTFLGTVTGDQGNFLTGGWTSNANLETGALNSLRNQTAKLGGNTVSLITNRAGTSGYYDGSGGGSQETNVVITGGAWRCN
ncbi:MAG: DUF4156 domain-containing protein [Pantoea sp.]|uniref:DUF4156 domain-containing protein n=1 Tax=Pantoea TaxID=53335 RepID=UPI000EC7DF70|nr:MULTISPECIES: DUF4156 domain-containing protein [Pantoea]MDU6432393.1 DUF4156 domain-containing protein [Pantoea sp.]RTY57637.1 DUF4156 domain-containing protein [Pantoea sp. YU22]WBV23908.1 DUF4156 domain-containing protein [Pantoea piersonii]HCX00782.1 DUF4156 domain-containing protein [Pantoea sp.]